MSTMDVVQETMNTSFLIKFSIHLTLSYLISLCILTSSIKSYRQAIFLLLFQSLSRACYFHNQMPHEQRKASDYIQRSSPTVIQASKAIAKLPQVPNSPCSHCQYFPCASSFFLCFRRIWRSLNALVVS